MTHINPLLSGLLHPTFVLWSLQGPFSYRPVNIQHHLNRKWILEILADALHDQIIINHHPLSISAGRSARVKQLFGFMAGGGSALEQTGGDCLLHQARNHITVSILRADYILRQTYAPRGLLLNLMQQRERLIC